MTQKNEKFKAWTILAVAVFLCFLLIYIRSQNKLWLIYEPWKLSAELPLVSDLVDFFQLAFLTCAGVLSFKFFCKQAYRDARARIELKRSQYFFDVRGIRKLLLIFSFMMPIVLVSSEIMELHAGFFGVKFQEMDSSIAEYAKGQESFFGEIKSNETAVTIAYIERISGIALSALREEIFTKILVLRILVATLPMNWALLFSVLIFGLSHTPARLESLAFATYKIIPSAMTGLLYHVAYLRLGLWASFFLHFLSNLMASLRAESWSGSTAVAVFFFCCTFVAMPIILFEVLLKKLAELYNQRKKSS